MVHAEDTDSANDNLGALLAAYSGAVPSVPAPREATTRFERDSFSVAVDNLADAHEIVKAAGGKVVKSSPTGSGYYVTAEYPA